MKLLLKQFKMWFSSIKTPYEFNVPFRRIPLFNAGAITLFPFIFYARGYRTHCIQEHERYHWNHILKTGFIAWYVLYGVSWLTLGAVYFIMYRKPFPAHLHPLEFEPYQIQWDCEAKHGTM